ncbi:phage protein, partial [Staphylococcus aureus WAMC6046]
MMYYKTGDVCQKIINVDGFDFRLRVKKRAYSVEIVVLDHEGNSIDGLLVSDENDLYTA